MTDTSTFGPQPASDYPTATGHGAAPGTADAAKDQAANVASTAASEAQAVVGQVAQEAKDIFGDVRSQLQSQATEQSERVASLLGDVGGQLRTMAQAGEPGLARDLVDEVAGQTQKVADRLTNGGLDGTLEDARRLARNRPGYFLAAAAAAGLVAARLARNVDTKALAEAAKPSSTSTDANGREALPSELGAGDASASVFAAPDLSLEATMPVPAIAGPETVQMPPAAPVPTDGRP